MFKTIYLTSLVLFSLTLLIACESEDSNSDSDSESVPTSSALITSRSPDHNDSNVPTSTNITITVDPSLINETLAFQLFNIGQNDNCRFSWEGGVSCPATVVMSILPTGEQIQGNTLVLDTPFDLDTNTNYLVLLGNDMTISDDDDIRINWTFRTGSNRGNIGVFLDSPVINMGYVSGAFSGVTNALGEYEYITGETVQFFIGNIVFPVVTAKRTVTPLDIFGTDDINNSKVINMIRLLQTLDQDGNPDNGLTITDLAIAIATARDVAVDFTLSVPDFESSTAVTQLITNADLDTPVSNLVTSTSAISHFQGQLDALPALENSIFNADTLGGTYDVVFAAVEGTHRYTFSADGTVFINWADGTSQTVEWSVNNSGELVFSGLIDDIFTLTSGDQSSGNLSVVLEDNDDGIHTLVNTTGTIAFKQ